MDFSKIQKRFINSKNSGYQVLKGKEGTGKSISALYKAINLENNYCIYNEDKVLYVTSDYNKNIEALNIYKEESDKDLFYSLFSKDNERVDIRTLEDIINTYSLAYRREKGQVLKNIDENKSLSILKELEEEIKVFYKKSKFLKKASLEFLLEEILWIKASNFSKDEYLNIDRKGRTGRIKKDSYTRDAIYTIKDLYNEKLQKNLYLDKYDHILCAISYVKKLNGLYTHIILDDLEKLTRAEIEFVKALYKEKIYSSFIFILNSELNNDKNSWIIKGRKLNSLGIDFKKKTYNFRIKYEKKSETMNTIENYKYLNLKNKNIIDFNIDTASMNKEIFEGENTIYNEDELIDVPMFNNIAAGNPIEINDSIEGTFYLPKYWLEKGKDIFILKVKGDSMVDKNICDGDLVVIKKQGVANHNDIVAASLDGEATLKTLNLNDEYPKLMPANSLYSPIILSSNRDVSILGVAIGIIKEGVN